MIALRKVYKSSYIGTLFPGPSWAFRGILRKLVVKLLSIPDTHVTIYFLTLNLHELREKKIKDLKDKGEETDIIDLVEKGMDAKIIQIYGEPGREAMEYVSVKDFLELVSQYFPIICVSKLCSFLKLHGCDVIVDGCSGPRSRTWDELITSGNRITILSHGDEYNVFLSTADILVRWVDEELRQSSLPLNNTAVNRVMKEWTGVTREIDTSHIQVVHIGNRDLGSIKPLSKRTIGQSQTIFTRHPIYFIFQEDRNKEERSRIENSPLMTTISNRIYESDGSYHFWKPSKHARLVREGDVAVVYGENGLSEARKLLDLKYPIEIWDVRE